MRHVAERRCSKCDGTGHNARTKFTDEDRARLHAEFDVLLRLVPRKDLVPARLAYEDLDRRHTSQIVSARKVRRARP